MCSLIILALCLFALMGVAGARGPVYTFEVKRELIGSYKEEILTIGGQSPGPTIHAPLGQTISVTLINRLREHVPMHWHNTHLIKSPGSDGIPPGETFTYRFIADRLGKSPYDSYYVRQTQTGLRGYLDILPVYSKAEPFAHDQPSKNYQMMTNIVDQNTTTTTPLGLAVRRCSPPTGLIRNGVAPQSVQSVTNKACPGYHKTLAFLLMQVWLIRRWTEGYFLGEIADFDLAKKKKLKKSLIFGLC